MRCDSCGTDAPPSAYCPACGGARPHAQRDPLVGTMLTERYEIVERLGEGGMGRVYRAIQRGLDRPVALKVIAPERAHAPELSARFVAEARALSKLNHPNIVRVLDFGRATVADGELMFLAMELLSGEDLRAAMHPGELLPVVACADIVVQVLAALAEVHHAGIAHRDIKPDNIRLTSRRDGRHRVKLIDFGVARHAEGSKVTRSGFVVGTPEYMAPEAAMGVAEGPESDLYAAGVVLFELLTGRPLFEGTPVEVLRKQISAPRPDPRSVSKRPLPDALAEVCARAIAIEPERRFPTAHAFAQALLRASAEAGWVTRAGAAFPSIRPARAIDATSTLVPARARATMTVTPVLPLVGRDAVLEELRTALSRGGAWALQGPSGCGRTRLLGEAASLARAHGRTVVRVEHAPGPRGEIGFDSLRNVLRELLGSHDDERALSIGTHNAGESVTLGMRMIFGDELPEDFTPEDVREVASAALAHAIRGAARGAGPAGLLLTIDDLDRADAPSRRAVVDAAESLPEAVVLLVSGLKLSLGGRFTPIALGPLDVEAVRASIGPRLGLSERELEPLAVERIGLGFGIPHAPNGRSFLRLMSEIAIGDLDLASRRVLQALAICGALGHDELEGIFDAPSDGLLREGLRDTLDALETRGFVRFVADPAQGNAVFAQVRHAIDAEVAVGQMRTAALADVHARRLSQLVHRRDLELAAHHAIRARIDFQAFVATEGAARLRARRGDLAGASEALWSGVRAGRTLFAQGEVAEAESAFVIFGPRLAETLLELDRVADARAVLEELLELTRPVGLTYAVVLESLARLSEREGDLARANAHRDAALTIAERNGDFLLAYRLRRAMVQRVPPWEPSSRPPGAPRSRSGRRARLALHATEELRHQTR